MSRKLQSQVHNLFVEVFAFGLLLRALGLGRFEQRAVFFLFSFGDVFEFVDGRNASSKFLDYRNDLFVFFGVVLDFLTQSFHNRRGLFGLVLIERVFYAEFGNFFGKTRDLFFGKFDFTLTVFALFFESCNVGAQSVEICFCLLYLLFL